MSFYKNYIVTVIKYCLTTLQNKTTLNMKNFYLSILKINIVKICELKRVTFL